MADSAHALTISWHSTSLLYMLMHKIITITHKGRVWYEEPLSLRNYIHQIAPTKCGKTVPGLAELCGIRGIPNCTAGSGRSVSPRSDIFMLLIRLPKKLFLEALKGRIIKEWRTSRPKCGWIWNTSRISFESRISNSFWQLSWNCGYIRQKFRRENNKVYFWYTKVQTFR